MINDDILLIENQNKKNADSICNVLNSIDKYKNYLKVHYSKNNIDKVIFKNNNNNNNNCKDNFNKLYPENNDVKLNYIKEKNINCITSISENKIDTSIIQCYKCGFVNEFNNPICIKCNANLKINFTINKEHNNLFKEILISNNICKNDLVKKNNDFLNTYRLEKNILPSVSFKDVHFIEVTCPFCNYKSKLKKNSFYFICSNCYNTVTLSKNIYKNNLKNQKDILFTNNKNIKDIINPYNHQSGILSIKDLEQEKVKKETIFKNNSSNYKLKYTIVDKNNCLNSRDNIKNKEIQENEEILNLLHLEFKKFTNKISKEIYFKKWLNEENYILRQKSLDIKNNLNNEYFNFNNKICKNILHYNLNRERIIDDILIENRIKNKNVFNKKLNKYSNICLENSVNFNSYASKNYYNMHYFKPIDYNYKIYKNNNLKEKNIYNSTIIRNKIENLYCL